jgi:hypothetical protein
MEFPEAASDLVGRTSARLLAAGVDRRERLAALHLLAILDASVDSTGRVRRPLDDLAGEFELEPLSVLRSLDHLQHAGAIDRDGPAVVLLGASDTGLGGMQLADFLDDVRASFEDGGASTTESRRRSPWLVRGGAALVAAAAAVAVFALAPTQPAVDRPLLADRASTTTVAPSQPPAETPIATTPEREPATTALVPAVDIIPETTIVAVVTCPTGEPTASIVDRILELTNPTTEDVVITGVTVAGVTLRSPITIPAGGTVTRTLSPLTRLTGGDASIDAWEWASTDIVRTCPS